MRTVRLVVAAYAAVLLLILGTEAAAQNVLIPTGEDGWPIYQIQTRATVSAGSMNEEMTYDNSGFSVLDGKQANTVFAFLDPIYDVCIESSPPSCQSVLAIGTARARANLYSGTLKAQASATITQTIAGYQGATGTATATLRDLLFFNVGSFDMTNGLPVKIRVRAKGDTDTFSEFSYAQVYARAVFTPWGSLGNGATLAYAHTAYGFGAPNISIEGSFPEWQVVDGAYETGIVLYGPLPVMRLFMDLYVDTIGGIANYYHTEALSLELPPGVTFTSASGVLLTRPDFENDVPVANAGSDQTVTAGAGCLKTVALDGTGSTDLDGDVLTFTWSGPFGTASGPTPTVSLLVGTHTITLTVDDGNSGPIQDTVTVVVEPSPSSTEICNGQDDDCDGTVDESPTSLTQPLTQSCYNGPSGTAGTGVCQAGTQTCGSGTFGTCVGEMIPTTEVCGDGIDQDCSGADLACPTGGSVTVLSPDGGEVWSIGSIQPLRWNSSGFTGNVRVELSHDGGATWAVLFGSTANDGTQNWTVTTPATSQALVRVSSVRTPGIRDISNAVFTAGGGRVTVLAPSGGQMWPMGSSQTIQWDSSGFLGNVRIELSRDGGATWAVLSSGTANDGAQAWKVTAPGTDQAVIRVSSVRDAGAVDTSDGVFTLGGGSVTVTVPSGGEVWLTGTTQTIRWTSSGLAGNVRIELSRDNGATWAVLFSSTANDGLQSWKVTGPVAGGQARLRVSSVNDVNTVDTSAFILGGYTILTPNGGESWGVGSTQVVRWTSFGVSDTVRLQLSRDGGTTWKTIVSSTADDGEESWVVTGLVTGQARVRVQRVNLSTVTDVSDGDFAIQ